MHIALLTLSYPPQTGGVQTYLAEVAQRLGRRHQVTVVTPIRSDGNKRAGILHKYPAPANALGYLRALQQVHPDRILVGHVHPQLLLPAFLYRNSRYLALAHGNDYLAAQKRWHGPLFNRLLARAEPLVTVTEMNAQRLELLGAGRARVIYPGTDPSRFTPVHSRATHAPLLLTVGRLVRRKGIDTVLRALPDVRRDFPNVSYDIAGAGPDETRLKALVEELELQDAVRFLGRVSNDDLPALYQRADIFVMPVREEAQGASIEGFGIVYLEASASGLPVIAGRSGGAVEAVLDGETGLVVEPTVEAVATAVETLLKDESLRKRLGAAGRRWVETEMHWDRAARQMAEALAIEFE